MYEELLYVALGVLIGVVSSYLVRDKWQETRINRLKEENEELEAVVYSFKQRERGLLGLEKKNAMKEQTLALIAAAPDAIAKNPELNAAVAKIPFANEVLGVAKFNPELALNLLSKAMKKAS